MITTMKYRLKPTKTQVAVMYRTLDVCRETYNLSLETKIVAYENSKVHLSNFDLTGMYTHAEIGKSIVHSKVIQNVARRVMRSFQNFYDKRARFPKFKSRRQYRSFTFVQSGFKVVGDRYLHLSYIGDIRIVLHRPIVGKIKSITIKVDACGDWWACFMVDQTAEEFHKTPRCCQTNSAVGIDLGIKNTVTLSDGTIFGNPRFLQKSLKKLKRAQRRLSRKQKGSRNRNKARLVVAKLHRKVANQRRDWQFKVANHIAQTYACVAIEDISSKFMLKNRKLARVASDAAWFQFSTLLEYELFKYQRESLQRISPRNTTQKCSNCGTLVLKDLSIRVHVCPCCGFVCDRDVNAGCNVVDGMSDELKSRYTLLKYNTARCACGNSRLWRHEPLRQ